MIVVSGGGRLEGSLGGARHVTLPVGRKNVAAGLACAAHVARLAGRERIRVIHAHSRVPCWVAWFARLFNRDIKFVCTAHALYSKNAGTWPMGRADAVICVSRAVRDDLEYRIANVRAARVIYNALPHPVVPWRGPQAQNTKSAKSPKNPKKIAYAGRLTGLKNLGVIIEALAPLRGPGWTLDVYGDGPKREELASRAEELGLSGNITFHGYVPDVPERLAASDLFVFPSRAEGLGLALAESLSAGVPSLASDTAAAREMTAGNRLLGDRLLPPDDAAAWTEAIRGALSGEAPPSLRLGIKLPSQDELAALVNDVYREALDPDPK